MYTAKGIYKKKENKSMSFNGGNSVGTIAIITILLIMFLLRSIGVLKNNQVALGYTYTQILDLTMPVVKVHNYDENKDDHIDFSFKDIFFRTLGIRGVSAYDIIVKEISIFNKAIKNYSQIDVMKSFTPFSLKSNSILKRTEEELKELNKISAAYDERLKKPLDNTKKEVLLMHTHYIENYSEASGLTTDTNYNVVGVGEVLAKELEEGYGISVIHDKTNHSVSYSDSYKRSNETLKKYLDEYGDFKLIIDLHRDGVSNKDAVTVKLNDENLAKLMLVTAVNSSRYEANQKLADDMFAIGSNLFPGLMKNTFIYDPGALAINSSLSDNTLLFEVGADVNETMEAKRSAKYIARIIAEYLNDKENSN